jgi:uncharacterized glyoxalase superfamily metalloenzyme YdcJ
MDPGARDVLLRQMQDDALAEQACFEDHALDRMSGLWTPVDRAREAELQAFMRASVDAHPQGQQALQHARGDVEGAFKTLMVWDIDASDVLPYLETQS